MAITIKRARMTVDLVTDLDLQADHEAALQALAEVTAASPTGMMIINPDVEAAAVVVQDIEKSIAASALSFTMQAVERKVYAEYAETHPPRPGDDMDSLYGFDTSEMDGLIAISILRVNDPSGTPVEFDPSVEWAALGGQMSDAQYSDFAKAILILNKGITEAPKSQAASTVIQRSGLN